MQVNNEQFQRLVKYRSRVWEMLKNVPNLLGVGIGLKEVNGTNMKQMAWRLYVSEKHEEEILQLQHILPPFLFGFPTDILSKSTSFPCYGDDTVDLLRPGVTIHSEVYGKEGTATLGCFAIRKGQPDKIVFLSNAHVIFGDKVMNPPTMKGSLDVGQPKVSCCWCTKCKVIGSAQLNEAGKTLNNPVVVKTTNGIAGTFTGYETDCALVDFRKNRNFTNDIEGIGMITGTPPAGSLGVNAWDPVEMVGSESGYVKGRVMNFKSISSYVSGGSGNISSLLMPMPAPPKPPERPFQVINDLWILPEPHPNDPTIPVGFGEDGDSGAVVVNQAKQVIGLLHSILPLTTNSRNEINNIWLQPSNTIQAIPDYVKAIGQVGPIQKVLDALDIEIPGNLAGTKTSYGKTIIVPSNDGRETVEIDEQLWLSKKADELNGKLISIPIGKEISDKVNQHRQEIYQLINHDRKVTVTWHRCKGPAFVAHILRNVKDPKFRMPIEIEGISRELLIKRMAKVLSEHGSKALANDIHIAYYAVIDHINDFDTTDELLELLQSLSTQRLFGEERVTDNSLNDL